MTARSLHRPYLWASLGFLTLGSTLGLLMLAVLTGWHSTRAWGSHVVAHAQFQVVGGVVLFTLGMALQLLAPTRVNSRASLAACALLATGTVVASGAGFVPGLGPPGTGLQVLGLLLYGRLFWAGQRGLEPGLGFFLTGQLWLVWALLTHDLDRALWGLACLYILGTGFRLHPRLLGCRRPPRSLQWTVLALWNLGLLVTPWLLLAACLLTLGAWARASQGTWLRGLYAMLALACLAQALQAPYSLVRHALATGFVLPMMVGMALELLPAFERRPVARRRQELLVGALLLAGAIRLLGQGTGWSGPYLLGGLAQVTGLAAFAGLLASQLLQRRAAGK